MKPLGMNAERSPTSKFVTVFKTWWRAWNAKQLEAASSTFQRHIEPITGRQMLSAGNPSPYG
jgi:hypothetical protein